MRALNSALPVVMASLSTLDRASLAKPILPLMIAATTSIRSRSVGGRGGSTGLPTIAANRPLSCVSVLPPCGANSGLSISCSACTAPRISPGERSMSICVRTRLETLLGSGEIACRSLTWVRCGSIRRFGLRRGTASACA